ncbi:MAG: monoheme cytochrome C [Flavobacteriaceae bacterium]|nr:MAG: monoheme cytochrome C [Flavobacteriaceae bacterium]
MNLLKGRHKKNLTTSILVLIAVILFALLVVVKLKDEQVKPSVQTAIQNTDIVDGIHQPTGLKDGEGLMTVVTHCTACHSAQLVIQNRMNRERWNATIRWMQETQNLWDLGDNQEVIVNYLVKNYPVSVKGRREKLENIEWYELTIN